MSGYWKFYLLPALFLSCSTGLAQSPKSTSTLRDPKLPVLKAAEPIEIIGTVIAHDKEGGVGFGLVDVDVYLDFLVIRVEKKLKGQIHGHYVRADFLGGSNGGKYLPKSLFDGTPWKIRLEPGWQSNYHECDWTIRPSPQPGSLEMAFGPELVTVGGAKSFPDVNALQCYVLERKNLQEISSKTQR